MTTKAEYKNKLAVAARERFNGFVAALSCNGVVRQWRCSPPKGAKNHFGWFDVTAWPHYLAVTGDLGDALFQAGDRDSVSWMMGLCDDDYVDYPFSKLRTKRPLRFLPGEARRLLALSSDDGGLADFADRILDELGGCGDVEDDGAEWMRAVYEVTVDSENLESAFAPDANDLWCVHAIKWLGAELLSIENDSNDSNDVVVPETSAPEVADASGDT